jgi:hypothetical protein
MKRRRKTDKFTETVIVTADDGTRFRCSVAALGRETEPRWVLLDGDGAQYMGPPVGPDKSHEAIEHDIRAWWEGVKTARAEAHPVKAS